MVAKCVMVLGTSSGAGKSWIATALCRWYAQQGYRVAPFKAQNMSNNARVVDADGVMGEIGSAQYFQALAAGVTPHVHMNPVLLKPEADTRSQVVLLGHVNDVLTHTPWRARSELVWPHIQASLDHLRAHYDVVVIEGAGSPAEINLMQSDIVNLRVAHYAQAKCVLVTDIDRGGAFAHLYGTWALLPQADQEIIAGFMLNKFRGDPSLLAPAPEDLEKLTGIPTVATIPMLRHHGLPEEDGVFEDRSLKHAAQTVHIAIVAYPHISNLDEYQALKNIPYVHLTWVRDPEELKDADWIILPGSKHTSTDLDWLRENGFDTALQSHAAQGKKLLGICGGLQMLGCEMIDPFGVDGTRQGLGLLPVSTTFAKTKTLKKTNIILGEVIGVWSPLSHLGVSGYEIHHGETCPVLTQTDSTQSAASPHEIASGLAWQNAAGNVLGIYLHGLFEEPRVLKALFGASTQTLEEVFDRLAKHLDLSTQDDFLASLVR